MDSDLYTAAISGDINVLKEKKITLRGVGYQLTPTKNNVLHLASQSGKTQCVQEILKMHPFLLRKVNSRGETALHLAAGGGHSDVVRALIVIDKAKRSSVNENLTRMANVDGDTALHEAARYNHLDVVRVLVVEDPNDSHAANKFGETPIYSAAYRGYIDLVRLICETCTSPTYSGPDGRTALHAAIICSCYECVACLLEKKKDLIKITDKYGWTAFHYAAYYDHHIQIKNLVEVDKVVAYQTENIGKRTPLHVAAGRGNITVLQELSRLCPDLWDMVDRRGQNILHIAVTLEHMEIIEFILKKCPVIKSLLIQRDNDGNTPLHLLANFGCFVPELIRHKLADREALNNKNLTPLDVAYGDEEEILMEQSNVGTALGETGVNQTSKLWSFIRHGEVDRKKTLANKAAAEKARETAAAEKARETEAAENARETATAEKARETEAEEKQIEKMRIYFDTHMLVAALIATVTFTSGFTLPGGFDGNEGPRQGMAILTRKAAFKAFMVTDTIGLLLSVTSLILYFVASIYEDYNNILHLVSFAGILNIAAIVAMMLAFITGTFAVLTHSSALAISLCVIGCSFFLILFYVLKRCIRDRTQEIAKQTSRGDPA